MKLEELLGREVLWQECRLLHYKFFYLTKITDFVSEPPLQYQTVGALLDGQVDEGLGALHSVNNTDPGAEEVAQGFG